MTKFQTVLLAILSAVVAGALYKLVPDDRSLAIGMAGLSVWLLGYAKQHPQDKAVPPSEDATAKIGQGAR